MGSTKIEAAQPAPAPSVSSGMTEYVNALPQLYQTQLAYEPLINQQEFDQAAKFAPMLQQLQATLYPNQSGLAEQVSKTASDGMQNGMSDSMKAQYLDYYRAEAGNQAGSGISNDNISRQMINQNEQYKQFYMNASLSAAGLTPLQNANNYQSSYSPTSGYGFNQTYGTMMQGYGSQVGAQASMYNTAGSLRQNVNNVNQGYAQMGMNGLGAMGM
jgi:hypothetical protein